jgi:hypothetical protein
MPARDPQETSEETQVRQALNAMLEDPLFARARTLRALLQFLVETRLAGKAISESEIAATVFGIDPGVFHPYTHPNVRVQMHNLRKKLGVYHSENPGQALRILLPESSYSPIFESASNHLSSAARRTLNQARLLAQSRFPSDLRFALSLIDSVLLESPSLGIGWAVQAEIHLMLACNGEPPLANLKAASLAADKALACAPNSWEAHVAKAGVLTTLEWDWQAAEHHFSIAIDQLKGGIAAAGHPWRQILLMATGRANELAEVLERVLETQDHPTHMAQINYGICLHLCRRHSDAERELKHAADLFPFEYSALSWLATVQWTMGHRIRALTSQIKAAYRARRSPPGSLISISAEGMQAATTGRPLPQLDSTVEGGGSEMGVALTSLIFGRHERATAAFERMAAHRFPLFPFLIHMELVDPLWQTPRFKKLAQSLGLPEQSAEYRRSK